MTLKGADVASLIDGLRAGGDRREAAIARLTIAGRRAVPRLLEEYDAVADRSLHIAILRVLEGVTDERALTIVDRAIASGGDVGVGAIAVLRELLGVTRASADVKALDRLLAIANEPEAEQRLRLAAVRALDHAPADVRAAIVGLAPAETPDAAPWQDAVAGHLPDDPAILRQALEPNAASAPLTDVQKVIDAIAAREKIAAPDIAAGWLRVRGALHQALALRGSRIALYDLRETVARAAAALPSPFLGALHLVGDDSCLEPLATAYARAGADPRWQHQLAQAFREIVKRERITKRQSALSRALAKAPGLGGRQ